MSVIDRPKMDFDAFLHAYQLEGEDVAGVSSVAKVGGYDETWGIASAWGFRVGYEGALVVARDEGDLHRWTEEDLRNELRGRKLTPWHNRDKATDRGSAVHDALEIMAQDNRIPDPAEFPEDQRGHVRSLLKWYLYMRPDFVATEVMVGSRRHRYAGRYDLRATVDARRVAVLLDDVRDDEVAERLRALAQEDAPALGLLDLKTSKRIYPTTHFPQLEGYEGAGIEMGFPATDFRAVLNTNEDGSFEPKRDFAVSWATFGDFLGLLEAYRAVRRMKAADPQVKHRKRQDETILAQLPSTSRTIVELGLPEFTGLTSRDVGLRLSKLADRGQCRKGARRGEWEPV